MAADVDGILERLRGEPERVEALVALAMDDLLSRPLPELVDPAWLSERLAEGLRASASDARTEAWIRQRIDAARGQLEGQTRRPREALPEEIVAAARDLLRRPYVPEEDLVGRLLDHRAVGNLLREVLQTALLDFAARMRPPAPPRAAARGRLSKLVGVAQEVAGVVGQGVERQLEGKVRAFVDGAIASSVSRMVKHLCSPDRAEELAEWRSDALDVLLDVPVDRWLLELDKLDPEGLVTDLAALLRAVAESEGLAEQIRIALEAALDGAGGRSARDFLEGSGLEEGWRPHLEALVVERVRAVVAAPAFAEWLEDLMR